MANREAIPLLAATTANPVIPTRLPAVTMANRAATPLPVATITPLGTMEAKRRTKGRARLAANPATTTARVVAMVERQPMAEGKQRMVVEKRPVEEPLPVLSTGPAPIPPPIRRP